ncbi:unnamed protein product, partial [Sphacelaria rigidula]
MKCRDMDANKQQRVTVATTTTERSRQRHPQFYPYRRLRPRSTQQEQQQQLHRRNDTRNGNSFSRLHRPLLRVAFAAAVSLGLTATTATVSQQATPTTHTRPGGDNRVIAPQQSVIRPVTSRHAPRNYRSRITELAMPTLQGRARSDLEPPTTPTATAAALSLRNGCSMPSRPRSGRVAAGWAGFLTPIGGAATAAAAPTRARRRAAGGTIRRSAWYCDTASSSGHLRPPGMPTPHASGGVIRSRAVSSGGGAVMRRAVPTGDTG